jgi:hypothetical protein
LPAKAAHLTLGGCFVSGALFALVVLGEVPIESQWIDRRRTVRSAYHAAGRIVLTAMVLLIVGASWVWSDVRCPADPVTRGVPPIDLRNHHHP